MMAAWGSLKRGPQRCKHFTPVLDRGMTTVSSDWDDPKLVSTKPSAMSRN